jgi:fructosamine-3-kinase
MLPIDAIAKQLSNTLDRPTQIVHQRAISGGCINQTAALTDQFGNQFFVKLNDTDKRDMFAAEAAGLHELLATNAITVPAPILLGESHDHAFLVLEYFELSGDVDAQALGEALAQLHRCEQPRFGWHRNNTIGTTPQLNDWTDDWISFYSELRLRYQLQLGERRGLSARLQRLGDKLLVRLNDFFSGYSPRPSLLHGDLWAGNYSALADGTPVIFDPAVYYGDRETDIAMTELFGGFSPNFYDAYNANYPLDPGYTVRKELYNLYHILNHANLFGGGYGPQAERMMERLLSTVS